MKRIFLIIGLLVLILPALAGDYSEIISYDYSVTASETFPQDSTGSGAGVLQYLIIPSIENYDEVNVFEIIELGTAVNYFSSGTYSSGDFTMKYTTGAEIIGTGTFQFVSSSDNLHDRIVYYFDFWDNGGHTGNTYLTITYDPVASGPSCTNIGAGNTYWSLPGVSTAPALSGTSSVWATPGTHQTTYETPYRAYIQFNQTPYPIGNGSSFDLTSLYFDRNVGGVDYPSKIDVRSVDGTSIFINGVYATSGTASTYIDRYPTRINVTFGNPVEVYQWSKYLTGDNPEYDIVDVSPTPTITPTATPTPDISTDMCGYWSFAVNTSNVVRMGYVTGTLTESDPDNKHKKIDWFVVLPSGQEITKYSYVYDEGLFGLGAGWVKIDFYAGTTTASSEAEAKVNSLQYVMAGNNQHMRVKIYEDKSLIPLAYHDYNLFCTLDQTVHVSETTQGLSVWNINAYDQLTNNLVSGITVHLYDYQSGEWQNKTTLIGGSYQFNVVPGNVYRIYIDESYWNTYDEDYTIPSPVPSQPYPVYLIRPLESIPDASWVMFYVRDGSTLNLMGGVSIALSDGQIQSTSKSGFAKFNVSDSTLYYWSASKTGYTGQSGTFNISSDTLLPDVYLYPAAVVTTPTTIPYWTQTPTPLPTYANGTVIPGYTYAPTVTATLNVIERGAKLTESTDVWYRFAPFLSQLIFIVVVVGLLGLMTKSLGGGGSGGRRRRY